MNINPNDIHDIHVFGCGGTGCHVAAGLARLEVAIRALGGEFPSVTLMDHDTVEAPNVGRQLYTPDEIGLPKAHALCQRMNLAYGLDWTAQTHDDHGTLNLVCVDSRKARAKIYEVADEHRMEIDRIGDHPTHYYLDFGNTDSTGQVVFGGGELNLPHEHLPALVDASLPDDNKPSCSLAEALESQELFVNQAIATYGLQILWQIFRRGRIENRGHHINLAGLAVPIQI